MFRTYGAAYRFAGFNNGSLLWSIWTLRFLEAERDLFRLFGATGARFAVWLLHITMGRGASVCQFFPVFVLETHQPRDVVVEFFGNLLLVPFFDNGLQQRIHQRARVKGLAICLL